MAWSQSIYDSFADYAGADLSQAFPDVSVEHSQRRGTHGISLVKLVQGPGAYPDPATQDLFIGYGKGTYAAARFDLGNGYFEVKSDAGCAVVPPGVAPDFFCESALEILVVGIPHQGLTLLTESVQGTAVYDFGVLHSSLQRDKMLIQLVEYLHHPDTLTANNALLVDGLTMALVGRLIALSQTPLKRREVPPLDKVLLKRVESYLQ